MILLVQTLSVVKDKLPGKPLFLMRFQCHGAKADTIAVREASPRLNRLSVLIVTAGAARHIFLLKT